MIQNLKPHQIRGDKFRMQLLVAELLSDNKIFNKFSDLAGIELDYDNEIFHEIEEFIVDKREITIQNKINQNK